MNSFGNIYRLTSFGESHGPAMGGVVDGAPAGEIIDIEAVERYLARRRPGSGANVTQRNEADKCEFLSGLMECDAAGNPVGSIRRESKQAVTLGTSIGFIVRNSDQHSSDYTSLRDTFRPSHADYAWQQKYGVRDWRGGGRSSGRETVSRCVAGALAAQILERKGIKVEVTLHTMGGCADRTRFGEIISEAREAADSVGGQVRCRVTGVPVGLGDPVFGKLDQMLAAAMMSIGGAKAFGIGDGATLATMHGSEANDQMAANEGNVNFLSNHSGGIQGGISNGNEIVMDVFFKPTPSIDRQMHTVNAAGCDVMLQTHGRHDPCIAVRAVPVVEAMAAMTVLDALLMQRAVRL